MLNIKTISIHPQFLQTYSDFGVFKSAIAKGEANIEHIDLRKYAMDKHGSIDAKPYGGGDGMVLRPEPLTKALADITDKDRLVILLSPTAKL